MLLIRGQFNQQHMKRTSFFCYLTLIQCPCRTGGFGSGLRQQAQIRRYLHLRNLIQCPCQTGGCWANQKEFTFELVQSSELPQWKLVRNCFCLADPTQGVFGQNNILNLSRCDSGCSSYLLLMETHLDSGSLTKCPLKSL